MCVCFFYISASGGARDGVVRLTFLFGVDFLAKRSALVCVCVYVCFCVLPSHLDGEHQMASIGDRVSKAPPSSNGMRFDPSST